MKGVYVGFYSNGHRLSGILRIPEEFKDGEKKPGIVVCHGFAAFKEMVPLPQVATAFTEAGYVTLTFDYRGFGTSEGPRWRLIPMEEVEDIRNAITFLQSRPEVDKEKIGLWGTSLGGGLVVYAAAMDSRVKCTVSNVPVANGYKWMKERFTETEFKQFLEEVEKNRNQRVLTGKSMRVDPFSIYLPRPTPEAIEFWKITRAQHPERAEMQIDFEFFEKILEFNACEIVHKISPRPIIFIYAKKDPLRSHAEELFEKAAEPKKIIGFDVHHHEIYKQENLKEVMKVTLEWYNQWLGHS